MGQSCAARGLQEVARMKVLRASVMTVNVVTAVVMLLGCGGASGGGDEPPSTDPTDAQEETHVVFDAIDDTHHASDATPTHDALDPFDALDARPPDTAPIVVDTGVPDTGPDDSVKRVLDFVWKGQETGYWCGPGSTRIALTTRMGSPPSQSELATFMGTTTAGTDDIGLVAGALNHYLGTSKYRSKDMYDPPTTAQRDGLKSDILAIIGGGWPMVANVISGWRPPGYPSGTIYHYVAIVGYDAGGASVLIADPAGAGAGGSGWTSVPESYWISIDDLGTWIGGKGYTGL
jgi:hypothetical protein